MSKIDELKMKAEKAREAAKEYERKAMELTKAEEAKKRVASYKQLEASAKEVGLDVMEFIALAERSIKAMQKYCSPRGKTIEAFIEQLENSER